jgi:rhodanese-related sulfurtransferase
MSFACIGPYSPITAERVRGPAATHARLDGMSALMPVTSTLKKLNFDGALELVDRGAAFVDLRPPEDYLDVHVPGSLALIYEFGPGMAARARDCIPLGLGLVIMDLGAGDVMHAAASLRGKGFTVLGTVEDAINSWAAARGAPASTETISVAPGKGTILDVGDPGSQVPQEAVRIPVERLWARVGELDTVGPVAVAAGYGVRACLAVGILERAGHEEIMLWRTLPPP